MARRRRPLALLAAASCVAVLCGAAAPGSASATTFTVAADAEVNSGAPTTTYGARTSMHLDASPVANSYLRFDVQGLSGPVTDATLRVLATSSQSNGVAVRSVSPGTWSESTINYSNAPAVSTTVTAASGAVAANQWVSLPVTALVTGNGTYSFALTTSGATALALATKESAAANAAQLVLTTSGSTAAPASTSPPTVTGSAVDGGTLTADPGQWSGTTPLSFAYQWRSCNAVTTVCSDIPGATAKTYTATAADVGQPLQVAVTAANAAGSASATSAQTAAVTAAPPGNLTAPAISGTARAGATLTASQGTWRGTPPLQFAYQWQTCDANITCTDLAGATSSTYTLSDRDAGSRVRVKVTASGSGSASAFSNPTGAVDARPVAPSSTGAPVISGTPADGASLSASPGSWDGTAPIDLAYQWLSCDAVTDACTSIAGATGAGYTITSADVGAKLVVRVTATNDVGSAQAVSAETGIVVATGPANAGLPTITGQARDGQTLTEDPGDWTGTVPITLSYQWQRCDATSGQCDDIPGETAETYVLDADDIGFKIAGHVTATNSAGTASADAPLTTTVTAAAPANSAAPTLSGTATDGQTMTVDPGTWTGSPPIDLSYQWQRCGSAGTGCADITGATGSTYTLASADVAHTLRAKVTATNPGGPASATSQPSALVAGTPPSVTKAPSVAGVPQDGQALTADPGTWTGSTPIGYAYQWQRCNALTGVCADIVGATTAGYTLASADVGAKIRVNVSASGPGGSAGASSAQTIVVAGTPPVSTTAPRISGTARDGQTLTADAGTWTGTRPMTTAYQWRRCDSSGAACADVSGATGSTYALSGGDVTKTLRVVVTASNAGGNQAATADATPVVSAQPPANVTAPTVTGTPKDGQTLTATAGTWSGTAPINTAYQWRRCDTTGATCIDIAGATGATYVAAAADVGGTLRAQVTASNGGGSSATPSAPTATVAALPPVSGALPVISGLAKDGQVLTTTTGTWTGTPPLTLAYTWRRCDAAGATCADIVGATAATYTLTPADVGKTIRSVVTASNAAGSAAAISAQTAAVTALAPANTALPVITGSTQQNFALTAAPGTWTGTTPMTFAYRWRRCDSAGNACTDISGATAATYTLTSTDVNKTIRVVVTASNSAGAGPAATAAQTTVVLAAGSSSDPVIAAAGDIACDPTNSNFAGGSGTSDSCRQKATSNLLSGAAAVLPLGDNQYYCGGYQGFLGAYNLSWGRFKSVTHPVVGNHEYLTSGGTDCNTANTGAAGYFKYFGAAAGQAGHGWYSYDIGSWHLIALNSNCGDAGGCGSTSPQGQWLKSDLAAHSNQCTLAYWHIPVFSSGGRASSNARTLYSQLYNANADVILSGHDHLYERFGPQTSTGVADPVRGIREFVVGTGGANHTSFTATMANSEVRNDSTYGVLKLTLHPTSYDWRFVPESGATFSDAGANACH